MTADAIRKWIKSKWQKEPNNDGELCIVEGLLEPYRCWLVNIGSKSEPKRRWQWQKYVVQESRILTPRRVIPWSVFAELLSPLAEVPHEVKLSHTCYSCNATFYETAKDVSDPPLCQKCFDEGNRVNCGDVVNTKTGEIAEPAPVAFQVGDIVRCVDAKGAKTLDEGMLYEVAYTQGCVVILMDHWNRYIDLLCTRFVLVHRPDQQEKHND